MSCHSPIYCKWPPHILILSIEAAYIPWPLSFSCQRIQKWSHPDNRHYLWGQIESYWKDRESVTHHTYTKPGVAYWLRTFFALLYWNDAFDKSVELIRCWAYPCFRVIFLKLPVTSLIIEYYIQYIRQLTVMTFLFQIFRRW